MRPVNFGQMWYWPNSVQDRPPPWKNEKNAKNTQTNQPVKTLIFELAQVDFGQPQTLVSFAVRCLAKSGPPTLASSVFFFCFVFSFFFFVFFCFIFPFFVFSSLYCFSLFLSVLRCRCARVTHANLFCAWKCLFDAFSECVTLLSIHLVACSARCLTLLLQLRHETLPLLLHCYFLQRGHHPLPLQLK